MTSARSFHPAAVFISGPLCERCMYVCFYDNHSGESSDRKGRSDGDARRHIHPAPAERLGGVFHSAAVSGETSDTSRSLERPPCVCVYTLLYSFRSGYILIFLTLCDVHRLILVLQVPIPWTWRPSNGSRLWLKQVDRRRWRIYLFIFFFLPPFFFFFLFLPSLSFFPSFPPQICFCLINIQHLFPALCVRSPWKRTSAAS